MKISSILFLCFALLGTNACAQSSDWDSMKPTGAAHAKVLPAEVKVKLRLAYEAALDVDSLASVDEYLAENQDAKRAIREAKAVANSKDAMEVVGDIELLRMTRETCRSCNTEEDFKQCHAAAMLWAGRIHTELGLDKKAIVKKP
jgi:hypothetical protein